MRTTDQPTRITTPDGTVWVLECDRCGREGGCSRGTVWTPT